MEQVLGIAGGAIWIAIATCVVGVGALAFVRPAWYARIYPWLLALSLLDGALLFLVTVVYRAGAAAAFDFMDAADKMAGFDVNPFTYSGVQLVAGYGLWFAYLVVLKLASRIVDPVAPDTPTDE